MAVRHEAFLQRFLLPLVQGGQVHIGKPMGAEEVAALEAEALGGSELLLEIERARAQRAATLWLYSVPVQWDPTSVRLAVAAHNLLFFNHPDAESWSARSGLARVLSFTASLLRVPPPATGAEAVARHTIAGGLLELQRDDVVLDTWLMVYNFRGQEPPPGLRRFPRLRRVRMERTRVRWMDDEELGEGQLELLGALLRASPLTDLLSPLRSQPTFAWPELSEYLGWQLLARLVAQRYLEMGLGRVGAALCTAFWELVASPRSPASQLAVRRVLGLLVYLCAAGSLGRAPSEDPLQSSSSEPLAQLSTLLAVAATCGVLPDALGGPLRARLDALLAERAQALGTDTLNELAGRLRAALE